MARGELVPVSCGMQEVDSLICPWLSASLASSIQAGFDHPDIFSVKGLPSYHLVFLKGDQRIKVFHGLEYR